MRPLFDLGADLNALDGDEQTPLFIAIYAGRKRLALELLSLGADPTIKTAKVQHTTTSLYNCGV